MQGAPADLPELVKDADSLQTFKLALVPLENENFNLTFSEWQKQKKPNYAAAISTKMTLTLSIQDFFKKFNSEIEVRVVGENTTAQKDRSSLLDSRRTSTPSSRTVSSGEGSEDSCQRTGWCCDDSARLV